MIVTRPGLLRTFSITAVAAVFVGQSIVGITWGLPSRKIDKYLFGDGEVWSGEKIYRLAKAEAKFDPTRGADVDVDPLNKRGDEPIPLTATEEDVAKIYLRYRLYTYQPDEMITMMALAGMRPSRLELDPRLYQYGGLFVYPVGALIKLCGVLGLINVRSDVVFYLDHPDEFGKFYIVARAYSAVWGLIGVLVVYAIAKRLAIVRTPSASAGSTATTVGSVAESGPLPPGRGSEQAHRAGLLAALLFTLMPVVVCMSHEGKPHLPGAVLMLLAVYFAMRCAEPGNAIVEDRRSKIERNTAGADVGNRQSAIDNRQFFWWMCVCCGAAVGMVLSSWPIFVLIPLVAVRAAGFSPRHPSVPREALRFTTAATLRFLTLGTAVALGVYLLTNPYILINAFVNREVLRSNFGNSLAMYQIARIGEGFARVVGLSVEGATLPIVALGTVAFIVAVVRKNSTAIPLVVSAGLFFLQFVLIGAGKPAEYGRFGIFTNTALAIGAGCLLAQRSAPSSVRVTASMLVIAWVGAGGAAYIENFRIDATSRNSRTELAETMTSWATALRTERSPLSIALLSDPAPYCCPPLPFSISKVVLVRSHRAAAQVHPDTLWCLLHPLELSGEFIHEPGVMLQETVSKGGAWRDTPISWANKPFSCED